MMLCSKEDWIIVFKNLLFKNVVFSCKVCQWVIESIKLKVFKNDHNSKIVFYKAAM